MEKSMKKYINCAIVYSVLGMVGGVFYREFTKFYDFTDRTTLSVVHTHYLVLGLFFFLMIVLLEKNFMFSNRKTARIINIYQVGLNSTVIMLVVRGVLQVLGSEISSGLNAAISGIAGLGHMVIGVAIIVLLLQLKKEICKH